MKTVLALYDTQAEAQKVMQELLKAGFDRDKMSIVMNEANRSAASQETAMAHADADDVSSAEGAGIGAVEGGVLGLLAGLGALAIPGIGPVLAAGPLIGALVGAGAGAVTGGLIAGLTDAGVPEEHAGYYAEGVRRGGTLLTVHADDNRAEEAAAIMNRYNPINLENRAESWRQEGWKGFQTDATPYTADQISQERTRYSSQRMADTTRTDTDTMRMDRDNEKAIPVVEEELQIGKRTVETGGVRIHNVVRETPVREDVTLREEHVSVERRPVDRAADASDMAFKESTMELRESAEEVVVNKRARVIEEVIIHKDVSERTETVQDTVRRTDVEVENLQGTTRTSDTTFQPFESYEDRYRQNFKTSFSKSDYTYDQYRPAYRYGYNLATQSGYRDRDWAQLEPEARRYWEDRNQGTWEDFKDAIRHGWNEVRGRA